MLLWSSSGFKYTNKKKHFLNSLKPNSSNKTRNLQVYLEVDIHCMLCTNVATFCFQTVFWINRVFAMVMLAYLPVNESQSFEMSMDEYLLKLNAIFNLSECERNFESCEFGYAMKSCMCQ
jgi:hypothetical protein